MTETPETYKEIRIALVLYGGVALATYINGACLELYELVKASRGELSPYQKIVHDLKANVTVDIISGASAGGLNGVALAKALVLGSDFKQLEKFWVKEAQIQNLLNNPRDRHLESLLSEKFYEKKLKQALGQLDSDIPKPRVESLDLFVATTDLHGNGHTYPAFDGESIYTKSHQYPLVYRYPNRTYDGGEDYKKYKDYKDFKDQNESLPKLWEACRATSAFPFAFPPFKYKQKQKGLEHHLSDGKIVKEEDKKVEHYLSDGGILNNKPFEQAIEAIAMRPADLFVDRALFYVEPEPSFTKTDYNRLNNDDRDSLPLDTVVLKTLLEVPRYESISEDLKQLQMHNDGVKAHHEAANEIEKWFYAEYEKPDGAIEQDGAKLKECVYEEFRKSPLSKAYQALKKVQVRQSMAQWLVDQNPEISSNVVDLKLKDLEKNNPQEYYQSFDVDFRVRRYYYLTRQLIEDIKRISRATDFASFTVKGKEEDVLKKLLKQKKNLLVFASEALKMRQAVHKELKDRGIHLTADTLTRYLDEAKPIYLRRFETLSDKGKRLVQEIDSAVVYHRQKETANYRIMFDAFELRDTFMLRMTFNRRLGERDCVELVPITPAEAKFINVPPKVKLAGESLFRFGGFFSEKWRKMDIMWGRLDAAEMIVRFLITRLPRVPGKEVDPDQELQDYLMPIQEKIFKEYQDQFSKGPTSDQNYRTFLQKVADNPSYAGNQTIADLPPREVVPTALKALSIAHGLAETLQTKRQGRLGSELVYGWLARGLGYVNNFANLASTFLFPTNGLIKLAAAIFVLGVLGWSIGIMAVNFSGFQNLAPATLFLAGLVALIAVTVAGFYYRPTFIKVAVLMSILVILFGLAAIDVRYSETINDMLGGTNIVDVTG